MIYRTLPTAALAACTLLILNQCMNKPSSLEYPIDVTLSIDSLGIYENNTPEFGPNMVVKVSNRSPDYILINERGNDYFHFIPTYNQTTYFNGHLENLELCSNCTRNIEYGFLRLNRFDTIWPSQEKTYLFEPFHGKVFQDSINYLLFELAIKSPYFDSLNQNMPYVFNYSYFEKLKIAGLPVSIIRHPFFVFSTSDHHRLRDTTNAFIKMGVIKIRPEGYTQDNQSTSANQVFD